MQMTNMLGNYRSSSANGAYLEKTVGYIFLDNNVVDSWWTHSYVLNETELPELCVAI
jgi:hypothetical protein